MSLVRSSDLFPAIVLTIDGNRLDQVVLHYSPRPTTDFFRHHIWNRRDKDGCQTKKIFGALMGPLPVID